jgi:methionyl-tRNA formyltransferase
MTIMHIVQALDAGPMIAKKAFRLDANETHGSLSDKLIADAIELLLPFATGKKAVPAGEEQDHDASTHCGKLHKQDCRLDPITMDIDSLDRIIRAFYPMPGAFVRIKTAKGEKSLKLLSLGDKPDPEATSHDSTPGLHRTEKLMWITDKNGASRTVVDVQMEGKPAMPAPQFLNGFRGELELA